MILSRPKDYPQPLKPLVHLLKREITMFWFLAFIVIFIGTPLLLISLAMLASEIGLTATVTVGLVLVVIGGAVSLPSALSLLGTGAIVYIVYQLVNRAGTDGNKGVES